MGGDNLGANLLKLAATVTLPGLLHLVNQSILKGHFCTRWKFHLVYPHYKKGDRTLPENFRPVCHLVEVGRVVELVVWDQLQDHCKRHNLIHKNHHGSVAGHDCVTAVGQVLDATT